jgi:hypothetical protein
MSMQKITFLEVLATVQSTYPDRVVVYSPIDNNTFYTVPDIYHLPAWRLDGLAPEVLTVRGPPEFLVLCTMTKDNSPSKRKYEYVVSNTMTEPLKRYFGKSK